MYLPSIFNNDFEDSFFGNGFDRFFDSMLPAASFWGETRPAMRTDIKETDKAYELAIDLPGFKKEDVKAKLKDGYLTITAQAGGSKEDNSDARYIRRERYAGTVSRSFYVGDAVSENDIKAKFEHGTLNIEVPKIQEVEPEEKFISIM